jgi:DNA repair exonuclease SbcCD ATPase subunit
MQLSDEFAKLKAQVEDGDRTIRTAVAKDDAALKAMVDEARRNADAREDELRAKSTEVAEQAERHWNGVKSDWDQHIQRIRTHLDEKKSEVDATIAEGDAEMAEADAEDAVQFAQAAIEEAEYAVLDAVMARRKADVMAAAR